jgi:hypothetical protein
MDRRALRPKRIFNPISAFMSAVPFLVFALA